MDRHPSHTTLVHLFSREAARHEVERTVPHILRCEQCWELAASVIEGLRRDSTLIDPSDSRAMVLDLLQEESQQALDELRSRGWLADLQGLSHQQQLDRIRSVSALQTQVMFDTVIREASDLALTDPHLGEETALTAAAIAELLPDKRYPRDLKSDLQGRALTVVANCRRVAANWPGSQAALRQAKEHLHRGTGDPSLEARLLSISASLASDTGNLETARKLLARAAALYRACGDSAGLASTTVQEASALLSGFRFEEAIGRAQEALILLKPREERLEVLARSIITECLIELRRPTEALRSLVAARPIYERFPSRRDQINLAYLEAHLLDLWGCVRESEKSFRAVINGYIDEELYKDAFLAILTFFESLYKRGAWDKAAKVCEDASRLLDTPLCHDQMKQVWAELCCDTSGYCSIIRGV